MRMRMRMVIRRSRMLGGNMGMLSARLCRRDRDKFGPEEVEVVLLVSDRGMWRGGVLLRIGRCWKEDVLDSGIVDGALVVVVVAAGLLHPLGTGRGSSWIWMVLHYWDGDIRRVGWIRVHWRGNLLGRGRVQSRTGCRPAVLCA
jgi:hypothetical protein